MRLRPTVSIRTSARCRFASSSRTPTAAALSCTTTKTSSQLLTASTPLGTFSLMYKSPFLTIIVVRILFTDHLTTLSASADQITEQGCVGRYMYMIIIIDIERKSKHASLFYVIALGDLLYTWFSKYLVLLTILFFLLVCFSVYRLVLLFTVCRIHNEVLQRCGHLQILFYRSRRVQCGLHRLNNADDYQVTVTVNRCKVVSNTL